MSSRKIERIIDKYKGDGGALISVLLEVQHENHWLSKEILEKVSQKLGVPMSRVQRVATFYKSFSITPEGRHEIHICNGTGCHVRGAARLMDKVQDIIRVKAGGTDSDLEVSLESVTCLGCCSAGPVMVVDGKYHGKMGPDKAEDVLKNL